jgi:hypothetical protein
MLYAIIYYTLVTELIVVPVLYFRARIQMAVKKLTKEEMEANVIKMLLNFHYEKMPPYEAVLREAKKRNFSEEFYNALSEVYFQWG